MFSVSQWIRVHAYLLLCLVGHQGPQEKHTKLRKTVNENMHSIQDKNMNIMNYQPCDYYRKPKQIRAEVIASSKMICKH